MIIFGAIFNEKLHKMGTNISNHKMRSCLWLVYLLRKHGKLSFREINSYWQQETDLSDGSPMAHRTFYDYLDYIQDVFGIVISCQRKGGYHYYIDVEDDKAHLTDWLISSFSIGQLIYEAQDVRDRVLIENAPQGMQYYKTIVDALHSHRCLHATYHRFDADAYDCHLRPYALKFYEGRWYLLAQKNDEQQLKTFALDRFEGTMTLLSDDPFTPPRDFDAAEFFANCFGIYTGTGKVPLIRLRATGTEVNYLLTKPLHTSQRQDPSDPSLFTLRCYPTDDLMYAILSHGRKLSVLAPEEFRMRIMEEIEGMKEGYEG